MVVDSLEGDLSELRSELVEDIKKEISEIKGRRLRHGIVHNTLVVTSIFVSGVITIDGIYNMGRTAAILGVILTVLLALQQAFPFGDMAFFYRCGIADLENLQTSLKYSLPSRKEIDKTKAKYMVIRKHLAEALPRGEQVMKTIMTMREETQRIQ